MSIKPSDFFVGLHDFFTILVPGGIFVIFIYANQSNFVNDTFGQILASNSDYKQALIILYAYIFGSVFKRIGSFIDGIYKEEKVGRSKKIFDDFTKHKPDKLKALNNYEFARFILLESESSYVKEVQVEMVSSKFFRSLIISLIPILIYNAINLNTFNSIGLVLLILFSFYQYNYLRRKAIDNTYKYALYALNK